MKLIGQVLKGKRRHNNGLQPIAVKVVDIFGNDTMTIVEVSVGKYGGKK